MPRTRPLTKEQKDRQEVDRVGGDILKLIRVHKGIQEKTYEQVAVDIDLSRAQLQVWRKTKCRTASLENVVIALLRLGYRINISPISRGNISGTVEVAGSMMGQHE